jgi:hypothetical protein
MPIEQAAYANQPVDDTSHLGRLAIFVHTPRTGGSSILALWRPFLEVVDHNLRGPEYRSLAQLRKEFPHLPVFGFVRNPWDRVLSAYCYLARGGNCRPDADDFVRFCSEWPTFRDFVVNGLVSAGAQSSPPVGASK